MCMLHASPHSSDACMYLDELGARNMSVDPLKRNIMPGLGVLRVRSTHAYPRQQPFYHRTNYRCQRIRRQDANQTKNDPRVNDFVKKGCLSLCALHSKYRLQDVRPGLHVVRQPPDSRLFCARTSQFSHFKMKSHCFMSILILKRCLRMSHKK